MDYFHSVTLDTDACKGCITCVKRCPTEAIRVREGKARILPERCIDCGECIRVCPHHAKKAVTDPLSSMASYKYKIALPAPSLIGQFNNLEDMEIITAGLLGMGFDMVYDVAAAAELVSDATRRLFADGALKKPVISSACPAVLRLIRIRFPQLLENVLPLNAPVEVAAKLARDEAMKQTGLSAEEICAVFITPCPAKMTITRSPLGLQQSYIDLAVSVSEVYPKLLSAMNKAAESGAENAEGATAVGRTGIGWGKTSGEAAATLHENYLAADGIENVINVLEEMEDERLRDQDFVELNACPGGCVGGVLNIENPYVAATRLKRVGKYRPISCNHMDSEQTPPELEWDDSVGPSDVMRLDPDKKKARKMLAEMNELEQKFYGLDCGSCGAPSCRALAEDIVRGFSNEDACIYLLKDKLEAVQQSLLALHLKDAYKGGNT